MASPNSTTAALTSGQIRTGNSRMNDMETAHATRPDGLVVGTNDRPEGQKNEDTHVVTSVSDAYDRPQSITIH